MEIVEQGKHIELAHTDDHAYGHHMSQEEKNELLKFGWWAYIASEVMLFSALIGTLLLAARMHPGENSEFNIPLVTLNTFLLLVSSWAVVRALGFAHQDNKTGVSRWLFLSFMLGTIFVAIQIYEYIELGHHGFTLSHNMYTSAFYILTGFHGAHVIVGVIWILRNFFKSLNGDFGKDNYIGIEVMGLYWHFVDVVWIFIFPLAYLLGG